MGPGPRRAIEKLREYRAVASIHRYVILEHTSAGATLFERVNGEDAWRANALTAADILSIPEIGIAVPLAELYENVDLPQTERQDSAGDDTTATTT